jgi:hypothetical protein
VSFRTDDWEFERCRVEPFPPFFFEFTWFIWGEREGRRASTRGVLSDAAMVAGSLVPYASS